MLPSSRILVLLVKVLCHGYTLGTFITHLGVVLTRYIVLRLLAEKRQRHAQIRMLPSRGPTRPNVSVTMYILQDPSFLTKVGRLDLWVLH